MRRFSLYLPDEMYEQLRTEAFNRRVTMNSLIINNVLIKQTWIDSKFPAPKTPFEIPAQEKKLEKNLDKERGEAPGIDYA